MTTFQIILVIAASIFIGIPLYLYVGKAGREIGAAMIGGFNAIFYWDSKKFQEMYDEMENDAIMKAIWLLVIIVYTLFLMIVSVIRLGWLAYLAIKAGAKFYWRILKYCWK